MFIIIPESLIGTDGVTMAGETTRQALDKYPVGGLVYFETNIYSEHQFVEMVKNAQKYSSERIGLPLFICVDEEGWDSYKDCWSGYS